MSENLGHDDRMVAIQCLIMELERPGTALAVLPQVAGIDWARTIADPSIPLVITNRPAQALRLCLSGQLAIAVLGASKATLMKWLRDRGANVNDEGAVQ